MQAILRSLENAVGGMNPLDWVIALIVGVSTVSAFMRGLIRSLFALAGMIGGILLAARYTEQGARNLTPWILTPSLARICAFVLILAAVYVAAMLLGRLVRGACSAAGFGIFDRLAGAVLGCARATLFLAALLLPLSPYLPQFKVARSSALLPYLLGAAHGISFVMPHDVLGSTGTSQWRIRAGELAGSALSQGHPKSRHELR